jgi:hypothetical protein
MASSNQSLHISMTLCRNGIDCNHLKREQCTYYHKQCDTYSVELNNLIERSNNYAIDRRKSLKLKSIQRTHFEIQPTSSISLKEKENLIQNKELQLKKKETELNYNIYLLQQQQKECYDEKKRFEEEKYQFIEESRYLKDKYTKSLKKLDQIKEEGCYEIKNYQKMIKDSNEFKYIFSKDADIQKYKSKINEIIEQYLCEICMTPLKEIIENEDAIEREIQTFYILECGHSLCKCCESRLNLNNDEISCPFCRKTSSKTSIKKNYLAETVLNISKNVLSTNSIVLKQLKITEMLKKEI